MAVIVNRLEHAHLRPCCCPGRPSRNRARRERRPLELLVDSPLNHQVGPWFRDRMREAAARERAG